MDGGEEEYEPVQHVPNNHPNPNEDNMAIGENSGAEPESEHIVEKVQGKKGVNENDFKSDIEYWESLNDPHLYQKKAPVIRYYMDGDEFKQEIISSRQMYLGNDKNEVRPVQHPENLKVMFDEDSEKTLSLTDYYYLKPFIDGMRELRGYDVDEVWERHYKKHDEDLLKGMKATLDKFELGQEKMQKLLGKLRDLGLENNKYGELIVNFADHHYGGIG